VAKELGYVYVDTGAMYRTLAWYCLKNQIDTRDNKAVAAACNAWKHTLRCVDNEVRLLVDGYVPLKEIRTAAIGAVSSYIATIPAVREWMKRTQRQCIQFGNLVMEGRDIGTNVFPETDFKFYLDAPLEERKRRRASDGIQENLVTRDQRDRQRAIAPLMIPLGARVINNSHMTVEETSRLIITDIQQKLSIMTAGIPSAPTRTHSPKGKTKKSMNPPTIKTRRSLDFQSPELFGTPSEVVIEPVHKAIGYFDHEKQVIQHPLFQRLRFIYQSDVMSLVWPGATHSRFLHSIGTMHVASRIFKTIVRGQLTELIKYGHKGISSEQRAAIQYFHACVRLAALLHGTGHAPFSHQFESAHTPQKIFRDPKTFKSLWVGVDWKAYYEKKAPSVLDHEHYSIRCAAKILEDNNISEIIFKQDIIGIMEKTAPIPSNLFAIMPWPYRISLNQDCSKLLLKLAKN
jgi:cytidylate kinase